MNALEFIKVGSHEQILKVEQLAGDTWREHYPALIGTAQVEYMLAKFQSAQAIATQIEQGYLYYLICQDNETPVGYFSVQAQAGQLFLSKIYLYSRLRGLGFGKQTMDFIEGLAKEMNCSSVFLTVNKGNLNSVEFYKKCGFETLGSVVQDIGQGFVMDDYKMVKSL